MRILRPSEVRAVRKKQGITQARLAELAGVTQPYIAKIESGATDPRISTLERISEVLEKGTEEKRITAGRVMAEPIISVKPKDKVKKAIELMEANDISQLPVLSGNNQVGSITDDLLIHQISSGEDIFKLTGQKVEDIMKDPLPTVSENVDVDALSHLLEHSPAILVLRKNKAVGVVTKADILQLSTGK